MKADHTSPKDLFEGKKQFLVPLFQRLYSWKKKQWQALWNDVVTLSEETSTHPPRHFIGSVVMHPVAAGPTGVSKYAIIDGQQRLTTIAILLTALRDEAQRIGHEAQAQEIAETYLLNKFAPLAERHKIVPTQADRPALAQIVLPTAGAAFPAGNIGEAYQYYRQKIAAWVDGQPAAADTLLLLILHRLSLVSITLDADDDPYVVFESLNHRGMQLTAADLIRNFLFMRIPEAAQDELNSTLWQPMQDMLPPESLTPFIRHWLMRFGGNVAETDVYGAFRRYAEHRDAGAVLQEMAHSAPIYARILRPELENERPALRRALYRLHQTRLTVAYPLLLRLYDHVRQGQLAEDTLLGALHILENFALRAFVTKRGTGGANRSMQSLAARTRDSANLLADMRDYLASQNFPADEEVREKLLTEPLYHHAGERNARTRLLLETLEASLNPKEIVATGTLSMEHIMPQTLTAAWRADLGQYADTDHQTLLHTLGNLTLSGWNGELSNAPFSKKREEFAKSNVALNKELAQQLQWNADTIRSRSASLADRFLAYYPALLPTAAATKATGKAASIPPVALTVAGQTWPVKTWIEVALTTIRACATKAGTNFLAHLAAQRPHYLSADPGSLRSAKLLVEGWYYEGHMSAVFHRQQCYWALAEAGIPQADWSVTTETSVIVAN